MKGIKSTCFKVFKGWCILSLVFVGLTVSGCSESDKDITVEKLKTKVEALQNSNSRLQEQLRTAQEKVGDLREIKGKGQLESAQTVWPWFVFIIIVVVAFFAWRISSAKKEHDEDKKSYENTIQNLKLSKDEAKETIAKLVNDVERLKQLNEEGERNQIVTEIKERSSRREHFLKKVGGFKNGKST